MKKFLLYGIMVTLLCSVSYGEVFFSDDMEGNPNPANQDQYNPPLATWFCPAGVGAAEGEAASVVAINSALPDGTDGSGNAGGYVLRLGYAYDSVSVRFALADTWQAGKSYTLSLDYAGKDHGTHHATDFQVLAKAYDPLTQTWTDVASQTLTAEYETWNSTELQIIPDETAAGKQIQIFFYKGTNTAFKFIDNVVLKDDTFVTPISPLKNQEDVSITPTFQWQLQEEAGFTPVKYVLQYRGDDPNWANAGTEVIDPAETGVGVLAALDFETQYYWRVLVYDTETTFQPSDNWSFTTVAANPLIITQPLDILVDPGQDAVFTILAINPATDDDSGLTYEWYKVGTAGILGTENVFSVLEAQEQNEAEYYCKVRRNGLFVDSDIVMLGVKMLEAHWTMDQADFDGTVYLDISGHDRHADPNGVPVFVEGADTTENGAVNIDPDNGWAIAGNWNPSEYTNSVTVSAWANWDGTVDTNGIVSKRDGYGLTESMWQFTLNSAGRIWVTSGSSSTWTPGHDPVVQDQWHHLCVSIDSDGIARAYVDGIVVPQTYEFTMGDKTDSLVLIGLIDNDPLTRVFNGSLDDIRIYNYARSAEQIVEDYYAISGKVICLNKPTMDMNDDCIVDIQDLGLMLAEWMDCGLVPDCLE